MPADEHLPEGEKRNGFQGSIRIQRRCDHGKVNLTVLHGSDGGRRGAVGNAEPDARIFQMEAFENVEEIAVQRGLTGTDGNTSGRQRVDGGQLILRLLDLCDGAFDVGIEMFAFRGQSDAAVGPDEEDAADFVLQTVHGTGHIGLVAAQNPGCLGEILVFCHVVENAVVLKIYIHKDSFSSAIF